MLADLNEHGLQQTARDIEALGRRAVTFAGSVSDLGHIAALYGVLDREFGGRVDFLANIAGEGFLAPPEEITLEQVQLVFQNLVFGRFKMCKEAGRRMLKSGRGSIVNISSTAGLGPSGSSIAYAVSKAGLISLTRCFAVALAPETLVNCVAPGLLEGTRATANLRPEQIERSTASSLLKRAADKDDCAEMVVTMCRTDTMTGQTVVIDAGRVFH